MTPNSTTSIPNPLKERDPALFREVKEFRARFEEILLADVEHIADKPRFRDRGHFLPREDLRAIAQVVRVLTSDSWTEDDLGRFDDCWRDALRSDFFAEAFESVRFRVQDTVRAAQHRLSETHNIDGAIQGTLW